MAETIPVVQLNVIRSNRDRIDIQKKLAQIAKLKGETKVNESILKGDEKRGIPGLIDDVASLLASHSIRKTEWEGYYHTITTGTNVSISGERLKSALMKRAFDPDEILAILEEVTQRTSYTTITTGLIKEEEAGPVTGAKYKSRG